MGVGFNPSGTICSVMRAGTNDVPSEASGPTETACGTKAEFDLLEEFKM